MSLIKAKEVLEDVLGGALSTGRVQRKNQDLLLPSDFVIADNDTVVILSERVEGELFLSEFCRCNGGTKLGNQIRQKLKSAGLQALD